ncbi:hypothetical protein BIT28_04355 [Photobacterium proteolyticum]|uniref:Uncharacterized protein n=1 Tax=Photobacterium proteolyticum TaxID=1903952 RepID=A0A1Q9H1A0_9GAMM|nr:hypothetical protein [Photobacterium proteolyticum]OLQ81451.1 hypothetical protein BIT28_04355 [Photobacterium proteolyticum]
MYKELLEIPSSHSFVRTDMKWDIGKETDIDTFWYDEKDLAGNIVAKYVVKVTKFIYPPQRSQICYQKFTPDSLSLLSTGELKH